jgi:hypothetical protein
MKGESADSEARSSNLLRGALVAAQVAACMVLLLAAGLLLRGLHRAQTIDPGFRMKNVAAIVFDLKGTGYDNQRAEVLQRQLFQRIAASRSERYGPSQRGSAGRQSPCYRPFHPWLRRPRRCRVQLRFVWLLPTIGHSHRTRPQFYGGGESNRRARGNPRGINRASPVAE